ncbi:MAG TPA: NAD(P)-binding domain-containing protein [Polyangiaceae bacterium]|jgi:3-hydroxyisobutyrate dehydrogenase
MTIAFFGMGLLGANFVRAMRRRGEAVHVWNRSKEKARALEADGAKAFDDAADAVRGASRVHLTLSDDAAVDAVLEAARPGFEKNVVLVDHTTTSPTGTAARAARWAERGVAFQHAPVFMGPPNALDGTGVMLASGDRARYDALAPELSKMTGKLVWLGEAPERAAVFKLMGNSFLMALTGGLGDMLALATAGHVAPADAMGIFDFFNPGASIGTRAKRVLEIDRASWELTMARKDARLMMDEAARAEVALTLVPAVAALMDRYIASGRGGEDWTVIAKQGLESNRA